MLHTKKLNFKYNKINFEALIEYEDTIHTHVTKTSPIYYKINLIKPISLDCGKGNVLIKNWISRLKIYCLEKENNIISKQFCYIEDEKIKLNNNYINIFTLAIKKIKYCYFNRNEINKAINRINNFNIKIDLKYNKKIYKLQKQKQLLHQDLKSNILNNKEYQKYLKPINKQISILKFRNLSVKDKFNNKYNISYVIDIY
jgi:ATP-dependent Lon protease